MFRFITFLGLLSLAFAGTVRENFWEYEGRIVNGEDTTIQQHPYQVSLQKDSRHFCGGSIINKDTIVTAAHCMQKVTPGQVKIRLGSTEHNQGGELVAVKAFRNHEKYDAKTKAYDVSVIKLASPVRETSNIRYISLADRTPKTGTPAVVTGWGTSCFLLCLKLPQTLQKVEVNIVEEKTCASSEYKYGSKIEETMVCGYSVKKDACQGDSGGPLVAENQLVGIVSWGSGCGRVNYPGVYCDVPSVRQWIEKASSEL